MRLTTTRLFFIAICFSSIQLAEITAQVRSSRLPADIEIVMSLEELPGMNSPDSFWECSYEVRVVDWKDVVQATEAGTSLDPIGQVLERGSWKATELDEERGRQIRIRVPVKDLLKHRLNQQSTEPQAFMLRSTVRIFDGELKQNIAMQVDRVWEAKLFPDGKAKIAIRVQRDGSYSIWGPIPKKLPPGYTTTTRQP